MQAPLRGPHGRGLLRLLAALLAAHGTEAEPTGPAAVVAYLPEWRYEGANWDTIAEHTTHLLLFSLEIDGSSRPSAFDRIPRRELLEQAQAAAKKHGTQLMLCFGGNGRSAGFSRMVRGKKRRAYFLKELWRLMQELKLDGVDYNWEYPGYSFASGYLPEAEIKADYVGLSRLIRESKEFFAAKGSPKTVTMAYYPDGRQEELIKQYKIDQYADLMHIMSYDQHGAHHSSQAFGEKCVNQGKAILPPEKITLGLPFYGRDGGGWTTYEDLVQRHDPLSPKKDLVPGDKGTISFNGVRTIEKKTRYALEAGLGGVMIWEVGQDCRLQPVTHGDKTHVRTCPQDNSSLLLAISRAVAGAGRQRARTEVWAAEQAHAREEL